jgi:hypothetical protein
MDFFIMIAQPIAKPKPLMVGRRFGRFWQKPPNKETPPCVP